MTHAHNERTSSPDESINAHPGSHVQTTKIEVSERTWAVVAILLAGVAIAVAFWAISEARKSERETRMLEYYVLEMDAKLIAAGVKQPEESVAKKLKGSKP